MQTRNPETCIAGTMKYVVRFGLFLVACSPFFSVASAQTFRDASALLGSHPGKIAIGASLVDVNSDGLVDLYRRGRLLLQQPDGTFFNRFEATGLEEEPNGVFGAVFGDYDGNGFLDIFFMNLNPSSKLYSNHAGMWFNEANAATGIDDLNLVQGSVWGDFNQDGQLDLFVGIDGGVSRLFINQDHQHFRDVAQEAGLSSQAAYGVAAADYDRDGDLDILLTQCLPPAEGQQAENVLLLDILPPLK